MIKPSQEGSKYCENVHATNTSHPEGKTNRTSNPGRTIQMLYRHRIGCCPFSRRDVSAEAAEPDWNIETEKGEYYYETALHRHYEIS